MKRFTFIVLFAILALSFGPGAKAGVMDESGGSASGSTGDVAEYIVIMGENGSHNKEFILRTGYYFQKAARNNAKDVSENGFSIGFGLSRFISEHQVFGLDMRTSLRVEPDLMIGFTGEADKALNHFSVPVLMQFDFPVETSPFEISAGAGFGYMAYDLGDKISRENMMPAVGKVAFDYIRRAGMKMGVEAKGHYVINNPGGPIDQLWGFAGVARISFLF